MPLPALLLILFLLLPLSVDAVIYQCRDQRGTLHLTDDPDNLPPGCTDRQERPEKEDAQATPASPATAPDKQSSDRNEQGIEQRTPGEDEEKSPRPAPGRREGER